MPPKSLPPRHGLQAAWVRTPDRDPNDALPWATMRDWLVHKLAPSPENVDDMLTRGAFVDDAGRPWTGTEIYRPTPSSGSTANCARRRKSLATSACSTETSASSSSTNPTSSPPFHEADTWCRARSSRPAKLSASPISAPHTASIAARLASC